MGNVTERKWWRTIRCGDKVVCRGKYASEFSLAGVVESITPGNVAAGDRPVYLYGVRLVNGNYKLFPPEDVRAA